MIAPVHDSRIPLGAGMKMLEPLWDVRPVTHYQQYEVHAGEAIGRVDGCSIGRYNAMNGLAALVAATMAGLPRGSDGRVVLFSRVKRRLSKWVMSRGFVCMMILPFYDAWYCRPCVTVIFEGRLWVLLGWYVYSEAGAARGLG